MLSRIHWWNAYSAGMSSSFCFLLRRTMFHLLAKLSAYPSLSNSRSTSFARLVGFLSARNVRTSCSVGSVPAMSMLTRRRNVASSHTADGGMPSWCSWANTASSMKLVGSGMFAMGAPSGMLARNVATCPWYRAITATSPASESALTSPVSEASAISVSLGSNSDFSVTSSMVPSLYVANTAICWFASRCMTRRSGTQRMPVTVGSSFGPYGIP